MPSSSQNPTPNFSPSPIPPKKRSNAGVITTVILVILVIIVAVAYAFTRRASVPVATTDAGANVPLNAMPSQTAGTPAATPANVVTSTPAITGLTLVNMETFPAQYQARVSFSLAETCSTASSSVAQNGNTFTVTVTSTKPADAVCGQVIVPSEQTVSIPTAGLAAGTYKVIAGTFSKSFTISATNTPTYTSGK